VRTRGRQLETRCILGGERFDDRIVWHRTSVDASHSITPETIHLWGETRCLDYANSVDWSPEDEHVDPEQTDVLRTEHTLGRWGRRVDLLRDDAEPASAAELRRARALRDAVYRLFSSISRNQKPTREDLDVLMSNLRPGRRARLSAGRRGLLHARLAGTRSTKDPLRRRHRRDRPASGSRPPEASQPLPRAELRMAVPQHQRTPALVLDVHLRQPREDAAAAPTPHNAGRLTGADFLDDCPAKVRETILAC